MPVLHAQAGGEALSGDGTKVRVPAPIALEHRGPVVQVNVGVSKGVAEQMRLRGDPVPTPRTGLALIDTGASSTCIDEATAVAIGLQPVDVVRMASASQDTSDANVYPVGFEVNGLPMFLDAPRAIGAALASQGLIMLIGRDLLKHCTLHYNGLAGEYTLSI